MSEENKALARTFIEAFSRGDAQAAAACLAPNAVINAKGFGAISGTRTYDFILATTAAFTDIIPTGLRPEFNSIVAEGNRVVVEMTGNAVLANGEVYNNDYCMTYIIEDGKIISGNEYFCTALADAKIGPLLAGVEEARKAAEG